MKRKAEEGAGEEVEQREFNHGSQWIRGKMIGKGGFGSVYIATLKKSKLRFSCFPPVMAVKSAEVSVSDTLQKEKQILENMRDCPHVIQCFGEEITTGEKGQMFFNLLLEFASGGTLAEEIKKAAGKGLPECDVKRYTFSILKGLDYVHQKGFVHCDLKPENILLVSKPNSTDWAKIGDFGLAERIKSSSKRDMYPCLKGSVMYMAPEVVISHKYDAGSDIWALGCVVLEMLTGKSPWQRSSGMNRGDLLRLISDPNQLPKIPSAISKEGKDFLKGCFERNSVFRLTSEMLLRHPFMAGLHEDTDSEKETESSMAEDEENENGDEDEASDSYRDDWDFLSDCYSMSEEALPSYAWSESEESKKWEAPANENAAENMKVGNQERERESRSCANCSVSKGCLKKVAVT